MAADPVSGPIPRTRFEEIVRAPYGRAKPMIQAYDPLWGRQKGEEIAWRVRFERREMNVESGMAIVRARTEDEARKKAAMLNDSNIHSLGMGYDERGEWEIDSVEPARNASPTQPDPEQMDLFK